MLILSFEIYQAECAAFLMNSREICEGFFMLEVEFQCLRMAEAES
jgi:hypothetical protein